MTMTFDSMALGVTIGAVSDTKDQTAMGLVKVKFNQKGKEIESDWVQVVNFSGGPQRGAFFLPQVGDSALLAFADGNPSKPYVLGFLWNGVCKPPVETAAQQQDVSVIKTRSGKTIMFDDSDPNGQILIIDQNKNQIKIDTAGKKISIESVGDLDIKATGTLTISAATIAISTGNQVKLDLSAASMTVKGGASLSLSADMIDLN